MNKTAQKLRMPLWCKRLLCLIPAVLAAILYFVLPKFPQFAEYVMSRGIFRVIAFPLGWLISLIPFSIAEVIVVLGIPAILTLLVIWIVRMVRSKKRLRILERGCRAIAWCVSLVLLFYMVMHGANFSRASVGELMDLPEGTYTAEDLYTVTRELAIQASIMRESLPEDEDGCALLTVTQKELLKFADDCYDPLREDLPFLRTGAGRVKSVLLSHLWSYTGITGMYFPWLGEANLNTDVPDSSLGFSAAHEIAHTMGFAREDECNFLAWLACSTTEQMDYFYSGYMQAYIYCSNALYKADQELWKDAYVYCSARMRKDLSQLNTYWKQFEGPVQDASTDLNDSFIKGNGVESGVLSYDEMVSLLLRYYDKQGLI